MPNMALISGAKYSVKFLFCGYRAISTLTTRARMHSAPITRLSLMEDLLLSAALPARMNAQRPSSQAKSMRYLGVGCGAQNQESGKGRQLALAKHRSVLAGGGQREGDGQQREGDKQAQRGQDIRRSDVEQIVAGALQNRRRIEAGEHVAVGALVGDSQLIGLAKFKGVIKAGGVVPH